MQESIFVHAYAIENFILISQRWAQSNLDRNLMWCGLVLLSDWKITTMQQIDAFDILLNSIKTMTNWWSHWCQEHRQTVHQMLSHYGGSSQQDWNSLNTITDMNLRDWCDSWHSQVLDSSIETQAGLCILVNDTIIVITASVITTLLLINSIICFFTILLILISNQML